MTDPSNAMAAAYKHDCEIAQAEAEKYRAALDGLLPWIEHMADVYCFTPMKHVEYRNAKEAVK